MKSVNFFYHSKCYTINLNTFEKHSKYFSSTKPENLNVNIPDFEFLLNYSEERVSEFIEYINGKPITFTPVNVISINYLSTQYLVVRLTKETENYINNHYQDIITFYRISSKFIHYKLNKAHF